MFYILVFKKKLSQNRKDILNNTFYDEMFYYRKNNLKADLFEKINS